MDPSYQPGEREKVAEDGLPEEPKGKLEGEKKANASTKHHSTNIPQFTHSCC